MSIETEALEFVELDQEIEFSGRPLFYEWHASDQNAISAHSPLSNVYFHSVKFANNSLYLWIGDKESKLENLSCGMQTSFANEPLAIYLLFGNSQQDSSALSSNDLARKLSKRLKKQVFVSLNVSLEALTDFDSHRTFLNFVEMSLFKEIKLRPQMF